MESACGLSRRIGRIDLYGQQKPDRAIVNFVTPGTVDAEIYDRCLLAHRCLPALRWRSEEILGAITRELHDIAESFSLSAEEQDQRLRQLADNAIRQVREEERVGVEAIGAFRQSVPSKSWRDELEAFETLWLSSAASQRRRDDYLASSVGQPNSSISWETSL